MAFRIDKPKYFDAIGYVPEKVQWDIHNSKARFRVNVQGRRSGKSYGGAREAEPEILRGNTRGWIVAPTYDLANKIAREIHQNLVMDMGFPTVTKRMLSGQMFYSKFTNQSEVWVKSADQPDSLIGEGLDWLIFDEAAISSKLIWEQYLRPTLSDRNGWGLFNTTPRGYNWIYDLYVRGQSDDYHEWASWQHPSWKSRYFRDNINDLKKELTKETFDQEYGAEFTSFAGKVYPFDRNIHASKVLKYIPEWDTIVSIDFGYRMPSVGWYQVGTVDGEPEVHLIDEISHETDIRTEILAQRIKQRNESKGYNVDAYYGDPSGSGVQAQSGKGDIETFRNNGIVVQYKSDKISKYIPNGVDLVRSFFENALGIAKFFVSKTCVGHISDYENYRYPERKEDRILKDEPMKDGRHDHGCDETRYFFTNRFPLVQSQAYSEDI